MSLTLFASLFFLCTALVQAVGLRVATFNIGAVYNSAESKYEPSLGVPGSSDYEIIRTVIARLDPDVIALQEIHSTDVNAGNVASLASALGFSHVHVAPNTNAFDNSLRVAFFSHFPYLTQTSVASPAGAKDMTRLIPAVKVNVPGTTRDPWLFAVHLKSGTEAADIFQRAVETRRLKNFITTSGLTGADNFMILGDFNPSGTSRAFDTLPASGLPAAFDLGDDIVLPITYFTDPRNYFTAPTVNLLDPRQLNGSTVTRPSSGTTLDLILTSPIIAGRPLAAEVYNSTLDVSNESGLPKAGSPLPPGTSAAASDHLALFGDFELDPALPYPFHAPGETVTEAFTAFPGTYDPYPWTTSSSIWQGTDNGSSTAPGFRGYGSAADPSLGFLPGATGGTVTAALVNQSPVTLTALQISYAAEQWRSAQNGSADTLTVELVENGVPKPLPALAFQAANNLPSGPISGGTAAAKSMLVDGLAIAPGATFQLKFSFNTGPNATPPPAEVFINEFDYDDDSTDSGEFVEVVAGPGFSGSLANVNLLLYNGSNGAVYGTHPLSTFTAGAVTASGHRIYSKLIADIQNGAPDGFALSVNGVATQFISYEGQFVATSGAASGMTSTDVGVSQTGSETEGTAALGLTGTGGTAANFTWTKFTGIPYSADQPNSGQTFVLPTLPPQGIAIDDLAVTFLSGYDADGDGSPDADELVFGTNPQDANSRFIVTATYPAQDTLRLEFPTLAGRGYVVESSGNLATWSEVAAYQGTGSPVQSDITISPLDPALFYRVRVTAF